MKPFEEMCGLIGAVMVLPEDKLVTMKGTEPFWHPRNLEGYKKEAAVRLMIQHALKALPLRSIEAYQGKYPITVSILWEGTVEVYQADYSVLTCSNLIRNTKQIKPADEKGVLRIFAKMMRHRLAMLETMQDLSSTLLFAERAGKLKEFEDTILQIHNG